MNLDTIYNSPIFIKVLATIAIIIAGFVVRYVIKITLNRHLARFIQKAPQKIFFDKMLKSTIYILAIIAISAVWVKDPWAFLVGFLAVISIGFIAVWSILSNLLAGILILMTKPFQAHDRITILPDDITGVVHDYNFFFIEIMGDDKSIISIPNNFIFQKIIKKFPK